MKFEHLVSATISDFQLLLEHLELPIAVGCISDDDFKILGRGYGRLDWDYVITYHYNPNSAFDFCFKLKENGQKNSFAPPVGAFLSSYSPNNKTLEIYGIERFGDNQNLNGRMLLLSMFAVSILMSKVDGEIIKLIDVEDSIELRQHYKSFGFIEDGSKNFTLEMSSLRALIDGFIS
ncbi:hypothetical protein ACUHGC_07650 [Testudinibacter sp. P27/CKL/0425]